jgi:hypothetical protein
LELVVLAGQAEMLMEYKALAQLLAQSPRQVADLVGASLTMVVMVAQVEARVET